MKLFGKKKSKVSGETKQNDDNHQEEVSSYFSQNQSKKGKKSSSDGNPDIEKLLAMDPSTLNSKQKRILRRYHEREGFNEGEEKVQKNEVENPQEITASSVASKEPPKSKHSQLDNENQAESTSDENNKSTSKIEMDEIEKKLHGLNSKERRKFLRELALDDSEHSRMVLEKAQEIAKKIAEENEAKHTTSKDDIKNQPAIVNEKQSERKDPVTTPDDKSTSTKKRKRKLADFSDLSPEERERREKQRQMQQEARIRRENGEEDMSRHPLNSERRRANRRKPGKTGKIAQFVKEKKQKQQALNEYNAGGYYIRHQKKN